MANARATAAEHLQGPFGEDAHEEQPWLRPCPSAACLAPLRPRRISRDKRLTLVLHRSYLLFVMAYQEDEGWATVADRTRRSILLELSGGERTVGELTEALPVSQPAVSQHLKVLKRVGLVSDRAEGTKRIYRLNEAGVSALRDQLDMFWKRTLSGFENLMEEER
jgi:DNA-binding transcriptional ArsR family regulator